MFFLSRASRTFTSSASAKKHSSHDLFLARPFYRTTVRSRAATSDLVIVIGWCLPRLLVSQAAPMWTLQCVYMMRFPYFSPTLAFLPILLSPPFSAHSSPLSTPLCELAPALSRLSWSTFRTLLLSSMISVRRSQTLLSSLPRCSSS